MLVERSHRAGCRPETSGGLGDHFVMFSGEAHKLPKIAFKVGASASGSPVCTSLLLNDTISGSVLQTSVQVAMLTNLAKSAPGSANVEDTEEKDEDREFLYEELSETIDSGEDSEDEVCGEGRRQPPELDDRTSDVDLGRPCWITVCVVQTDCVAPGM